MAVGSRPALPHFYKYPLQVKIQRFNAIKAGRSALRFALQDPGYWAKPVTGGFDQSSPRNRRVDPRVHTCPARTRSLQTGPRRRFCLSFPGPPCTHAGRMRWQKPLSLLQEAGLPPPLPSDDQTQSLPVCLETRDTVTFKAICNLP